MNQYLGIGNLTKEPKLTVAEHDTYCTFTVAVNNRGDDSTFVDAISYGKQAEACSTHLQKGSLVCIKGIPNVKPYLDKDNNPRACLQVKVKEIDFLKNLKAKQD